MTQEHTPSNFDWQNKVTNCPDFGLRMLAAAATGSSDLDPQQILTIINLIKTSPHYNPEKHMVASEDY